MKRKHLNVSLVFSFLAWITASTNADLVTAKGLITVTNITGDLSSGTLLRGEVTEEAQRRPVEPVDVVAHEHDWPR